MAVHGVIMAGGIGARFWPQSRKLFPKQLLKVFGEQTLIQQSYTRIKEFSQSKNIKIVTNNSLVKPINDQISELKKENFIVEPFGKNTAPCLALSAFQIVEDDPEAIMVVVPADHFIKDINLFNNTIHAGIKFAQQNNSLITIGLNPTHPETGYGYIQKGQIETKVDEFSIFKVKTFAEKPNIETAVRFLESGDFVWNSGMFIWKAKVLINAIEKYLPDLFDEMSRTFEHWNTEKFELQLEDTYKKVKSISIDYGIMQEAENVFMIPGNFQWNDVGSWDVVSKLEEDNSKESNIVYAKNKSIIDSTGNYVNSPKKLVATIGIDDLIVIDTEDALLICKKGRSQEVKDIVDELKIKGLEEFL